MTTHDFIDLADALRQIFPIQHSEDETPSPYSYASNTGRLCQNEVTIQKMADILEAANPRFRRQLWLGYIAGTHDAKGNPIKKGV